MSLPDILALGATPGQVKALHQKAGLETPEEFLQQVVLKGLGPKELGEKLRDEPDFLARALPLATLRCPERGPARGQGG